MQRISLFQKFKSFDGQKYILDIIDKSLIEADVLTWADWFKQNPGKDILMKENIGKNLILTSFFGVENRIFETLIFDENGDDFYCESHSSWKEAMIGHIRAVNWLQAANNNNLRPF